MNMRRIPDRQLFFGADFERRTVARIVNGVRTGQLTWGEYRHLGFDALVALAWVIGGQPQ